MSEKLPLPSERPQMSDTMRPSRWHAIWSKRQRDGDGAPTLAELLALDGFDILGGVTLAAFRAHGDYLAVEMDLRAGETIFDVGCGAGAFLYPFHEQGHGVGGLDYAANLVQIAATAMPGADDPTIFADIPTYAVFRDPAGDLTYVAYNAGPASRLVTFTDGFSFTVGPRETASFSTSPADPDAPVVLLLADKVTGKAPLTIQFTGSQSFDPNGSPLTFAWSFAGAGSSTAADTTVTFSEVGDHWVRLTITNALALSAQDSVKVTVLPSGTPYSGLPVPVPGRIQAENYDNGGEGIAYHDMNANNIGLVYRPAEGVDLEAAAGGGYDLYWIVAGEWIEYTFSVAEAGYFDFVPFVATVPGFGNFTLSIDNVDVSGKRPVPSTGGFQFWTPIRIASVPLAAGTHIMRFDFDSDTDKTGWLFSINYIDVERVIPSGVDEGIVPAAFGPARTYPNPFNPQTTIEYVVPAEGPVRLAVFDARGRQVRLLADGRMPSGTHTTTWDGRDDDGHQLASGLYFLRFKAAGVDHIGKMVLLK